MGLKEMQIMFDNAWATYYTGSKVAGRLVLHLDAPKKVREIKVKFKGEANVKWSETETRKNAEGKSENHYVDYTADETYFENKFVLAGECEIPAGTHNYDFSTILPPQLPSSYEGQYGHIRYTVKVTLDRPWKFDQECKSAFTVICPLDLNYSQEARMPIKVDKEKSVGACCCAAGTLSASMSAPYSGFTSGQVIPLTVDVENGTTTSVTEGSVILRKVVTYKCRHPSSQTKVEKTDIETQPLTVVGAHGTNTWLKQFTVPALPATNTIGCSIITIAYEIKVKVPVAGMFLRGLELTTPVIIGTVPLMNIPVPGVTPSDSSPGSGPAPGQIGWAMGDNNSLYPNLPPPSYEESAFGKASTIQDKDDNEHTMGVGGWIPRYPTYNFTPTAPSAPPATE